MARASNPVLVEVTRGTVVESRHHGAAVVVDATGAVVAGWGDITMPVFPRSAVKPLQALALVESGAADRFGLTARELALAASSHSGTPEHTALVEAWLHRIGLAPSELECGCHEPMDADTAHALVRAGRRPGPLHHNCSGKHSGFLTLCRHLGVPPAGYVRPEHPAMEEVTRRLGEMTGCDMASVPRGVDGCGIPTFALPLQHIAVGMARLADPGRLPALRRTAAARIVAAMAEHPFLVGGPGRFDTEAMGRMGRSTDPAVTGLATADVAAGAGGAASGGRVATAPVDRPVLKGVVKGGAEGVHIAILPRHGLGIAVKIDDGAKRASEAVLAAILVRLGVTGVESWAEQPVLNNAGRPIGLLRTRLED